MLPFLRAHWKKLGLLLAGLLLFALGRFSAAAPRVEQREEAKLQESTKASASEVQTGAAQVDAIQTAQEEKIRIVYRTLVVNADGSSRLDEKIEEGSRANSEIAQSAKIEVRAEAKQEAQTDRELLTRSDLTIDPSLPRWKLSLLGGASIPDSTWEAGAEVEYRVAGPFWIGAAATNRGRVLFSVGVQF